jgi:hypothetical protein
MTLASIAQNRNGLSGQGGCGRIVFIINPHTLFSLNEGQGPILNMGIISLSGVNVEKALSFGGRPRTFLAVQAIFGGHGGG